MIVPPEGRGVVGVNTSVKGTDDFPATRSDDAMTKDTCITCVNMPPDVTKGDVNVSNEVATLTPTPPAVAAPMVKPLNVTVNADAPMLAPDVVMTTAVEVVAPHVAVRPATLLAPTVKVGVTDGAKKPDG